MSVKSVPTGVVLKEVLTIASELLEEEVGPADNFFEHHGDSLKAIEFCERVEERLDLLVDLEIVWDAPDFASLVQRLIEGEPQR